MEQTIDVNPIPYLTWSWLKINKDSATFNFSLLENEGNDEQLPEGVIVNSGKAVKTELPEPESSIGKAAAQIITNAALGKIYTFEKDCEEPLIIRINAASNSATHNIIHAKAGVNCKVIIVYEGGENTAHSTDSEAALFSGIITKVYAENDSNVQITKVQLFKNSLYQIDDTQIICGERAKANLIQIELGACHIDAGFHATLQGYQSKFTSDTAYICRENQYLDMNQIVVHTGKKTDCNMKTDGSVKDSSTKTYRGTIDMRKGCSGSTGNEMETTLLLSPKAVVKAAPIILCGEDDIAAEHGSTVGKLSPEMLFYINTRGIDQAKAETMLTRAKITAASANIPEEKIRDEINKWLDREIGQD